METKSMISEGLTVNQLEERLEMANGWLVCCSESVVSCGGGMEADINVVVTINK